MLSLQEYKQSKNIPNLVEKMFEVRQITHNLHLKSKSFSEHEALGVFYGGLLDLVDNFIETYQGQYGLINDYNIQTQDVLSALEYMEDSVKLFVAGRDALKDSHLQNIMDEIIALTFRTIYKLKFLK